MIKVAIEPAQLSRVDGLVHEDHAHKNPHTICPPHCLTITDVAAIDTAWNGAVDAALAEVRLLLSRTTNQMFQRVA